MTIAVDRWQTVDAALRIATVPSLNMKRRRAQRKRARRIVRDAARNLADAYRPEGVL